MLMVGGAIGFGAATLLGYPGKQVVRVDAVTLKKTELHHVLQAIEAVKDKESNHSFWRYVADSGVLAFECPTEDVCNLEVPARAAEKAKLLTVTQTSQTEEDLTAARPQAMADLNKVLTDARKPPAPVAKSFYERLQLKSGDIIAAINEQEISNPFEALKRLDQLAKKSEQVKTVTLLRDGQRVTVKTD